MADEEYNWLDDAFDESKPDPLAKKSDTPQDAEFDWIDDAFDDAKTAADMARARGPKVATVLLIVVMIFAVLLVAFAFFGIIGSLESM